MARLLYSSETRGCGATIELDSAEGVLVSIDKSEALVRQVNTRGGLFKSITSTWSGRAFYREKNLYRNIKVSEFLERHCSQSAISHTFMNPVLSVFANAIWSGESAHSLSKLFTQVSNIPTATEMEHKQVVLRGRLAFILEGVE
jgi:hypothetical protein